MCKIAKGMSSHLIYVQDMYTVCTHYAWMVTWSCQYTSPIVSCLHFLPWCMVIGSYRISSDNSNNQWQWTAGYKQTIESPEFINKSNNHYKHSIAMCNNSSSYICLSLHYTSNDLICGFITGIHFYL